MPGVVSGDFDFAFGNTLSVMVAQGEGLDLEYVANGTTTSGDTERDFGAVVVPAASAAAALLALQSQPLDVIVSDIGLPEQDGYGLIRAIRALPAPIGQIPAMALTAYARPEDRRLALLAGFQLHLAKPVDNDDLCTAVASLAGTA